jgi:hypothetical protein
VVPPAIQLADWEAVEARAEAKGEEKRAEGDGQRKLFE